MSTPSVRPELVEGPGGVPAGLRQAPPERVPTASFDWRPLALLAAVALDATSPAALGNLAAVLYQRDKLEEAFEAISSALQRDPEDSQNQALFERIGVAREQSRSESPVPWYRKLWRQ